MTKEEKQGLMQRLFGILAHYGLQYDALLSFKKRKELLEKLKLSDNNAWQLINTYIESEIKLDRIKNDTEKKEKKAEHWNAEIALVEKEKNDAASALLEFEKANKIAG